MNKENKKEICFDGYNEFVWRLNNGGEFFTFTFAYKLETWSSDLNCVY